ncbi:MAG TPA: ABC transporter substrate-binding protein [Stellaceae bacterium]|jgi:NitT/TauT family transport system substrate-binding protein
MGRRLLALFCILFASLGGASAAELQKITVGYVPVADFAPLFVAVDKHFFEKQGLDVTLTKILLASNVPGALVAGSLDIGMGTPPMLLITNESGLDFQAIAAVSRLKKDNPFVSVITRKQENITDAAQLKDKRVGVPGFNSSMDITFRKWLMDRGIPYGDGPGQVHLVEAIFPQMRDLLAGGQLYAAIVLEPFRSRILGDGTGSNLRDFFADLSPDAIAAIWMAKRDWIAAHGDIVNAFRAGLVEGIADLQANPDEFQAIQMKYLGFASAPRPDWSLKISKEDLAFFVDVSKQVGLIHQQPQIDKLIAP